MSSEFDSGECDVCGGPQQWTIHRDMMFVRCVAGCQSLFPEERVNLPPSSEGLLPYREGRFEGGTYSRREGVPLEGADANQSDVEDTELLF